ncbi:hypothetical protein FRZ06_07995 [Anoxybacterium hadale]|uniref:Uncharacterized protein n=1 Tax=Anoxybacterium hadale TaxID=3408580 RepID=A0ACD1A9V2_9FIRM|nr:hypothetical protein FRZ06_07995 [Clostridiales bacterium]
MICAKETAKNPFQITTPENLDAQTTVSLFVDVFTDFPKVIDPGHVFLTGPRGVGKSMMFRYLQADCQCLVEDCVFSELPFIGIYIPIKNWSLVKTELKRLDERHASEIFNEHLMVSQIATEVFDSLLKSLKAVESIDKTSLIQYCKYVLSPLTDCDITWESGEINSTFEILSQIKCYMNSAYSKASMYTKKLAFDTHLPMYDGPLYDYQDFLVPLLSSLSSIIGFPKGTIYLLIDDAHFLTDVQTRILNSWIATRTSGRISLKVSSQYDYKNYYTVTGSTIDSPHDFTEIDMATVYTANSGKSNYKERIQSIVARRLALYNINVKPELFFPVDEEQEKKVETIATDYRKKYDDGNGKGYYRDDDAYRYARPDYIKSLAGKSKSSSTYSYSGFDQLVHLSSGIVRYFLEPAHIMYSKELAIDTNRKVESISPSIQNRVVRDEAENFLFIELERYKKEGHESAIPKEDLERLSNLVQGLGGLFRQILLSERSERRVFSIAISDNLTEDVERILDIGVNFGFFHRSTIGRKNRRSGGRTKLYIMNKRLAPIWNLDPTGFSGYLFIKNAVLQEGIRNPQSLLARIERSGALQEMEYVQLNLFTPNDEPMANSLDM